jgi:hypothetical protein
MCVFDPSGAEVGPESETGRDVNGPRHGQQFTLAGLLTAFLTAVCRAGLTSPRRSGGTFRPEQLTQVLAATRQLESFLNPDRRTFDDPIRMSPPEDLLGLAMRDREDVARQNDPSGDTLRTAVRRIQFGMNFVLERWGLGALTHIPPEEPVEIGEATLDWGFEYWFFGEPPVGDQIRIDRGAFRHLPWVMVRELARSGRMLRSGLGPPHFFRMRPRLTASPGASATRAAREAVQSFHRLLKAFTMFKGDAYFVLDAADGMGKAARRIPDWGWNAIYSSAGFEDAGVVAATAHMGVRTLTARVLTGLEHAAKRVWERKGVDASGVPLPLAWTAEAGEEAQHYLADQLRVNTERWRVALDVEEERWRQAVRSKAKRVRVAEQERAFYLDDHRRPIATGLDPVVTAFLTLIATESPDPIKFPEMRKRRSILKGVNQVELRQRLPEPLATYVRSGRTGYYFELPPLE